MKYYILAATLSLACLTTPVYAGIFGDDSHDTYNNSEAKAKASLKARLSSNSRSQARAKAEQDQRQHQGQQQGQQQGQGQIGINKNVGPTVVDNSVVTYEAAAVPPSLGQGDPGYDCSMTGGIGASGVGFGGSIQWSDASINCELGMLYRLGAKDPDTRDRALDAYDVLYQRILEQASGAAKFARDASVREGR